MDVKKTTHKHRVQTSVMTLAIMNVTAVVSLRGLPAEAVYGLSSAFYLFAAIVFSISDGHGRAELAAMFSDNRAAPSAGSARLRSPQWDSWPLAPMDRIDDLVPHGADLRAVSIAFIGMNDVHDAVLASNKVFRSLHDASHVLVATFIALQASDGSERSANGAV